MVAGFRPREERIRVLIPSRMRCGADWMDIRIHNLSSRGLMAACDATPSAGSYVEVRRGSQAIIGRVVWSKEGFFGLRSQDRIAIQSIISEPRLAGRPDFGADRPAERRSDGRLAAEAQLARRLERNRSWGSAFQFAIVALVGIAGALFAAQQVYGLLSQSTSRIEQALSGG